MLKPLVGPLLASLVIGVQAQEQSAIADAGRQPPPTRIEAFSSRTGVVLIKGITTIGEVARQGRVTVEARELRDASTPKAAQYGIAINVKEAGRLERESLSYIDEDEIDSLLKGIDYIAGVNRTVTKMADFEAKYKTRGDFAITVFSSESGELMVSVESGRIGRTSAFLKLAELERLKQMIVNARSAIADAKAALDKPKK